MKESAFVRVHVFVCAIPITFHSLLATAVQPVQPTEKELETEKFSMPLVLAPSRIAWEQRNTYTHAKAQRQEPMSVVEQARAENLVSNVCTCTCV